MKVSRSLRSFGFITVLAALGAGSLSYCQETAQPDATRVSFTYASPGDGQSQPDSKTASPSPSPSSDDNWHFIVAPYLWLTGIHGTVGTANRQVGVHASVGDVLSNFRFGLMGLIEADKKRFVLPVDIIWARLGDDKALPFPNLRETSADVKVDEFILTPEVGYRLVNQETMKIDALTGFRYWHLGQNLKFNPSRLGLNFSDSQNWVDPLVGGRLLGTVTPKVSVTIAGDVGGWGVGSQLDYQVVGLLGYKVKPSLTLQAGWRYLDVNYRSKTVFDTATSGALIGVTINLK